jgi:Protein of unknown function (DUF3613)
MKTGIGFASTASLASIALMLAFGVVGTAGAQSPAGARSDVASSGAVPGGTSDPATSDATAMDRPAGQTSRAPRASEVGHATLAWLDLQRSGRAAAPLQPTLGVEASLAYQRYIESFRTKIPASFTSSIDTGYSGNQLHVDYTNGGGPQN